MAQKRDRGSRNWAFTLNNYTPADVELYQQVECRYMCFGYEKAPETGTPHLQGFVAFTDAKPFASVARLLPRAHIAACKGNALQNEQYCKKDGDFWEKGVRPLTQAEKGETETERWRAIRLAYHEGRIDDIDPAIYARYQRNLESAERHEQLVKRKFETLDGDLLHEWHHGPTRVGKSSYVRELYPGAYVKEPGCKWWDGYNYEDVAIFEDLGPGDKASAGAFKRWLDRFPFRIETKGGMMLVRPKKVVITSNYAPRELFEGRDADAIEARLIIHDWGESPLELPPTPGPDWSEDPESI